MHTYTYIYIERERSTYVYVTMLVQYSICVIMCHIIVYKCHDIMSSHLISCHHADASDPGHAQIIRPISLLRLSLLIFVDSKRCWKFPMDMRIPPSITIIIIRLCLSQTL